MQWSKKSAKMATFWRMKPHVAWNGSPTGRLAQCLAWMQSQSFRNPEPVFQFVSFSSKIIYISLFFKCKISLVLFDYWRPSIFCLFNSLFWRMTCGITSRDIFCFVSIRKNEAQRIGHTSVGPVTGGFHFRNMLARQTWPSTLRTHRLRRWSIDCTSNRSRRPRLARWRRRIHSFERCSFYIVSPRTRRNAPTVDVPICI